MIIQLQTSRLFVSSSFVWCDPGPGKAVTCTLSWLPGLCNVYNTCLLPARVPARVLAGIFTYYAATGEEQNTPHSAPLSPLLSSPTLTLGNTWTKHRYGYQIINMCFAPRKIFFGPFLQSYFYFSRTTISTLHSFNT